MAAGCCGAAGLARAVRSCSHPPACCRHPSSRAESRACCAPPLPHIAWCIQPAAMSDQASGRSTLDTCLRTVGRAHRRYETAWPPLRPAPASPGRGAGRPRQPQAGMAADRPTPEGRDARGSGRARVPCPAHGAHPHTQEDAHAETGEHRPANPELPSTAHRLTIGSSSVVPGAAIPRPHPRRLGPTPGGWMSHAAFPSELTSWCGRSLAAGGAAEWPETAGAGAPAASEPGAWAAASSGGQRRAAAGSGGQRRAHCCCRLRVPGATGWAGACGTATSKTDRDLRISGLQAHSSAAIHPICIYTMPEDSPFSWLPASLYSIRQACVLVERCTRKSARWPKRSRQRG
jgi:hypothetical protein